MITERSSHEQWLLWADDSIPKMRDGDTADLRFYMERFFDQHGNVGRYGCVITMRRLVDVPDTKLKTIDMELWRPPNWWVRRLAYRILENIPSTKVRQDVAYGLKMLFQE